MWPSTSRTRVRKTSAWWARRSVSSSELLVGLAGALPAGVALLELARCRRRRRSGRAAARSSASSSITPGWQHQVAHRPARQAEQAQQPALHLGALDEQREVALAPQQRLEPVDEADRRLQRAALLAPPPGRRAPTRPAEAHLALVAQHPDPRLLAQRPHARRQLRRQLRQEGLASTGCGAGPQLRQPLPAPARGRRAAARRTRRRRTRAPRRAGRAARRRRSRSAPRLRGDPGEVAVGCRQQVGLLVVEVLDAVLDPAQQGVGRRPAARRWRASSGRRRRACRAPSASSGCGSRGTGRRAPPAAAGR